MSYNGLKKYGTIPIDASTLHEDLVEYRSPKDKVSKLEKSGVLIRLKKGLYVVSPTDSSEAISTELIANHLYGPSYISFESALSFYGFIPERTYIIRSATIKRKKQYQTPFGEYEYITVPKDYFSIGLQQKINQNSYAFLIAGPEKAICDLILATSGLRIQSKKAMKEYLFDDLRIDIEAASTFNYQVIDECAKYGYKKTELSLLSDVISNINKAN